MIRNFVILMRLLFLIIIVILIVLFEFTLSGKIAIFNVRPNLILVFFVLIFPIITETKQKNERKSSLFLAKQNYADEVSAKWQFFLIAAACGLLFDIFSIEHGNGFYFAAFLLMGVLICFLFRNIPFKNILFGSIAIIIILTFIFNLMFTWDISYVFSKNQLMEIIYNAALLILIFGIINFRKIFKMLKI